MLQYKLVPSGWREARTTFQHKDESRRDPNNWRPIRIGSEIQCLFHRRIANRLKTAFSLNILQKDFVNVDGALANVELLEYYISMRRKGRKSYNVVSLDISKAFDLVSHQSLIRALWRLDIEEGMIKYIQSNFRSSTIINIL